MSKWEKQNEENFVYLLRKKNRFSEHIRFIDYFWKNLGSDAKCYV